MPDQKDLEEFLSDARVEPAVLDLRPDYRVLLVAVDGLRPGPSDELSHRLVTRAESAVSQSLRGRRVEDLPHVAAWRDAYRAFGLPRVNRLTDIYNALSVLHQVPIGGEDLSRYSGSPRLARATGDEPFDTVADGAVVVEHPAPGEVVWCDDAGVTCRRWNWRQGVRTQLREDTRSALFILDALDPLTDDALTATADELVSHLHGAGEALPVATRLIAPLTGAEH